MPQNFRCKECGLAFSVGWYHYHDFSTGFGAATLTVCRACCAQHKVEHALDLAYVPTSLSFFDVTIEEVPALARLAVMTALRARLDLAPREAKRLVDRPPITVGRDVPRGAALELKAAYASLGAIVRFANPRTETIRDPIPQRQDRLLLANAATGIDPGSNLAWESVPIRGAPTGCVGAFNLEDQACASCAAAGTLTTDPAAVPRWCCRCRSSIEETGAWVT